MVGCIALNVRWISRGVRRSDTQNLGKKDESQQRHPRAREVTLPCWLVRSLAARCRQRTEMRHRRVQNRASLTTAWSREKAKTIRIGGEMDEMDERMNARRRSVFFEPLSPFDLPLTTHPSSLVRIARRLLSLPPSPSFSELAAQSSVLFPFRPLHRSS